MVIIITIIDLNQVSVIISKLSRFPPSLYHDQHHCHNYPGAVEVVLQNSVCFHIIIITNNVIIIISIVIKVSSLLPLSCRGCLAEFPPPPSPLLDVDQPGKWILQMKATWHSGRSQEICSQQLTRRRISRLITLYCSLLAKL